ncbi:hypothetical protein BB559_001963 [Furculomyces boomerangus]|uniref:Chitin-binding type-4 domain-containing protein n=1 Tax=Furculomyces boomerangus TaxID=61424 RepID=A0A2T9YZ38_9FUNG|nr:hypothetical protein BB559_001963 [Furculomyces boomerangus]
MTKLSIKSSIHSLAIAYTLFQTVAGHMAMQKPCPRFGGNIEGCKHLADKQRVDYDMNAPIGPASYPLQNSRMFCKGNLEKRNRVISDVWEAGQEVTVEFVRGGANHEGGHCQFSISYDFNHLSEKNIGEDVHKEANFIVVHEKLGNCFFDDNGNPEYTFKFRLPKYLPSSKDAVFAWSWVNARGNREFYMNCADIEIVGNSCKHEGTRMVVANYLPDHPIIPEFNKENPNGLELYTKAENIVMKSHENEKAYEKEKQWKHDNSLKKREDVIELNIDDDDNLNFEDLQGFNEQEFDEYYKCEEQNNDVSTTLSSSTSTSSSTTSSSTTSSSITYSSTTSSSTTYSSTTSSSTTTTLSSSSAIVVPSNPIFIQCKPNTYECVSDKYKFHQCDHGVWILRDVAPGTRCEQDGEFIKQVIDV